MYQRLKNSAAPIAIVGGLIWAVTPLIATHAPAVLPGTVLGVLLLVGATGGIHITYRELRSGFYEEVGFAVLLLGFFTTTIAIVTYSPANTDTIVGTLISSIPIVAAVLLVSIGTGILSRATLNTRILPVWTAIPLFVAMPLDPFLYYAQLSTIGVGISTYGIVGCVGGAVLLHDDGISE